MLAGSKLMMMMICGVAGQKREMCKEENYVSASKGGSFLTKRSINEAVDKSHLYNNTAKRLCFLCERRQIFQTD